MEPGTLVDRYVVEEELGRGGLAVVYRVRHRTLGTRHALKVLTIPRRSVRERLVQEGILQARLAHPHIVAVTDVLELDEGPGLLMEYVEGGNLEERIEAGPLSLREAERLFRGVLAAVAHAHAQGVVHRDLKPANVLLAPGPEGVVPKVADFGLAKVEDATADLPGRKATRTGMTMGTPSYMSPEQVRDSKNVDARTDIFALGCILYELVTGRVAFEGPDVLTIFNRIVSGDFPPLHRVDEAVPERIHHAIEAALRVDPEHRVASCDALAALLDGGAALPAPAQAKATWADAAPQGLPVPMARAGVPAMLLMAGLGSATLASLVIGLWLLGDGGGAATTPPAEPSVSMAAPIVDAPRPPLEPTPAVPAPEAVPQAVPAQPAPSEATPAPQPAVAVASRPVAAPAPRPAPPAATPVPAPPAATPAPAADDLPPPLPSRPLPTCDALLRCMLAVSRDEGPLGEMMGSSMADGIQGVQTMARMDGMGDFDADGRCRMMLDAYQGSFATMRDNPSVDIAVPAACE